MRPTFVNRLGWTRGYWETFGNIPISDADRLESLCFRNDRNSFETLNGSPIAENKIPKDAILSILGLGNYNVLEALVVAAVQKRAQNGA